MRVLWRLFQAQLTQASLINFKQTENIIVQTSFYSQTKVDID